MVHVDRGGDEVMIEEGMMESMWRYVIEVVMMVHGDSSGDVVMIAEGMMAVC